VDKTFASIEAFAIFMRSMSVREKVFDTIGRQEVATALSTAIKEKIGNKSSYGSPTNWKYLAESTIAQKGHDNPLYETGTLQESIGWQHNSPRVTIVGSTDPKSLWHEIGPTGSRSGHYPARSMFASTIKEYDEELFALYVKTISKMGAGLEGVVRIE
jgi:hypothetical protein